jgi:hypothetical protein
MGLSGGLRPIPVYDKLGLICKTAIEKAVLQNLGEAL